MLMNKLLTLLAGTLLCATIARGQVVKNNDFSQAKSHWEGMGQVVVLDNDQKPAAANAGGVPQLQVVLNRTAVQEAKQRLIFKADETAKAARVTLVVKTSPDFSRNSEAQQFSKDPKWRPGSRHTTKDMAYPNVDLTVRVDADHHYYLLRNLKTSGDWQTFTGEYPTLGSPTNKTLSIIFPAGTGTIWVKSVSVEPQ